MPISNYTYGTDNMSEHNYYVYLRESGGSSSKLDLTGKKWSEAATLINSAGFTKIGGCDEKPSIKITPQTKKIAGGKEVTISETINFVAKDLEVSSDNYHAIRKSVKSGDMDVMFMCEESKRVTIVYDIPISASLNVDGIDNVELKGSLKTTDSDKNLTFVTNWLPES